MVEDWKQKAYVDHYNRLYRFDEGEIKTYLDPLQLNAADVFVDFGCGKGSAVFFAASIVKKAVGIDVSEAQLVQAREGLNSFSNVDLLQAGFLSCDLRPYRFSKGAARKALHHLTDEEKGVFFSKLASFFEPGGLFVLEDAVFDFDRDQLASQMPRLLLEAERYYGPRWNEIRKDFLITINEEFSTGRRQWEMALTKGGFKIVQEMRRTCFYATLVARKEG